MSSQKNLTCIALIPARSGSTRIKNKNIRLINDHPLIAYSISSSVESCVFSDVIVSTDSQYYADIATHYGANVPFLRPVEYATSFSPDIEWIKYTLKKLKEDGKEFDCFCIIRPTSPFRSSKMIQNAWQLFISEVGVDSLRAVELCTQHPGKMWMIKGRRMVPLLPFENAGYPWHSSATQTLPHVYIQNASLEIAWTSVPFEKNSIAGDVVMPFLTEGYEGFDLNIEIDWQIAEEILRNDLAKLPSINKKPYLPQK